jgi:GR25 family glycosyltransferase involved in LPS biosynthesis
VFNADLDISWTNSHLNFTGKLNSTVFEKMIMGLEVDRNSSLLLPTFFHDLCDLAKYRLDSVRCMNDYLNNVTLHHLDERFNTTGKWPFIDQVFVLHYKKKPERLNHMRDLLYQFNVSSKVIKDFDRDELTQDIIECAYPVNRTIDSRNWQPKNLSTGEISLSLKHFAAFDYIIKNKIEYALIFEDDVVIEGNLTSFDKSFRNAMLDLPADYDLYFVGGCLDLHCKAVTGTLDAPKACPQNNRSRCTHAYVISYRGALKMVKNLPIRWAIDWLMNSEGIGLKIYHAEPPLFLQGKSFESTGIRQGVET